MPHIRDAHSNGRAVLDGKIELLNHLGFVTFFCIDSTLIMGEGPTASVAPFVSAVDFTAEVFLIVGKGTAASVDPSVSAVDITAETLVLIGLAVLSHAHNGGGTHCFSSSLRLCG